MTAEERSAKFSAEIDAIERMTPDECRAELQKMARERNFVGMIATAALEVDREPLR